MEPILNRLYGLLFTAVLLATPASGAAPAFTGTTATICNVATCVMIPGYTVSDSDGDTFTYVINPAVTGLTIDSDTGLVTTSVALSDASYTLVVTDSNAESVTQAIAFTVFTDGNPPTIGGTFTASVAEDVVVGTTVTTTYTVADGGDTTDGVTYEISGTDVAFFKIGLFDGVLTTAATLDYETKSSLSVDLTVKDSKRTASSPQALTITVTDVDEAPVCNPDTILKDMLDGSTVGTQVVTLSCIDPESNTITYDIPTGNTNTDYSISVGGVISVANVLNKASTATYSLSVTATANSKVDTVAVTVTVLADTAPVCSPGTIAKNMADGATVGTQVATLSCIDTDAGAIIAYAIVSGNTNTDYSVSGTGVIEVAKLLAIGTTSTYTLSVTATSNFKKDTVTVTVTVIADKAPVCSPSTITKNMADGAIVGTEVTTLSCTDPESQALTYTFLDGNKDDDFAMVSSTGKMTVAKVLNKGRTSSYVVKAAVVDTASLTATTTTTITVVDTSGAINIANHLYIVAGLILLMKYLFE